MGREIERGRVRSYNRNSGKMLVLTFLTHSIGNPCGLISKEFIDNLSSNYPILTTMLTLAYASNWYLILIKG